MVASYLDDIVNKIISDKSYTYEFICEDRGNDGTGHANSCGIYWTSSNTGTVTTKDGTQKLNRAWDFGIWKSTGGFQMVLLQGHGMSWSEFPNTITVEVDGKAVTLNKNTAQKEFPAYTIGEDIFNLQHKVGQKITAKISW